MKPRTIAIDGPSGSGKSTIGEMLAQRLGYLYFDTGVMYRAVTCAALQRGLAIDDEASISALAEGLQIDVLPPTIADGRQNTVLVDGHDVTGKLRAPEIDANVSAVASYAAVRRAMVRQQRAIGARGHVVMIGRDIGTVVLPDSELKVYLTAGVEERARRRQRENAQRGDSTPYGQVLQMMRVRDAKDMGRENSPLRPAPDAHRIDSERMEPAEIVERIVQMWE